MPANFNVLLPLYEFMLSLLIRLQSFIVFCKPLQDSICMTCGSQLELSTSKPSIPAVIPRKKKKKKKDGLQTTSRAGTPMDK